MIGGLSARAKRAASRILPWNTCQGGYFTITVSSKVNFLSLAHPSNDRCKILKSIHEQHEIARGMVLLLAMAQEKL